MFKSLGLFCFSSNWFDWEIILTDWYDSNSAIIKLCDFASCSFNWALLNENIYRKTHNVFTRLFRAPRKYVLCVQFFVHSQTIYLWAFSFSWFRVPRTALARIQTTIHLGNHFNVRNDNTITRNNRILIIALDSSGFYLTLLRKQLGSVSL